MNQPAQGEIVDGLRAALRKADAEDLRFEARIERVLPRLNPRLLIHDVPTADTATFPWGYAGDAFNTTDFHHEVNDEVD